jgi:acarbose 7IV-phosphotransferase
MRIFLAGLINLETTLKIEQFPLEYTPSRFAFFGIGNSSSGVGLNVATALSTLGAEVHFCSFVGTDLIGQLTQNQLESVGISLYLETMPEHPHSIILVDKNGQRAIHADFKDIQERTMPLSHFEKAMQNAEAAVICNINFARPALGLAQAKGIAIYTDLHAISHLENPYDQDFLQAANTVFFSGEKLQQAEQTAFQAMQRFANIQTIVVGMGANGALLLERNKPIHLEPAVVNPNLKSTIGAGDALFSSFVFFHLKLGSAKQALVRAVRFASHKLGQVGGASGFVSQAELEAMLH